MPILTCYWDVTNLLMLLHCLHDDVDTPLLQTSLHELFDVAKDKLHVGLAVTKLLSVIVDVTSCEFQL